jgi:S-adenosylhomocysteine hydrolase
MLEKKSCLGKKLNACFGRIKEKAETEKPLARQRVFGCLDVTKETASELACLKLSTTGISIDLLTAEGIKYSTDYSAGT